MSQQAYTSFLASPSAAQLTDDAALLYVTTLTTLHEPTKIIKDLTSKELRRKHQKIISAVEDTTHRTLAVEVDTTIEFVTGGGAYLPGLDDNFVSDRIVNFPVIHFVHFDTTGKIRQIRQLWDQGSLLKHIEVIGARGKNWPITDGIDQIRLISSCENSVTKAIPIPRTTGSTATQNDEVVISSRAPAAHGRSNAASRDAQTSSTIFGSRDSVDESAYKPLAPLRSSAKPPARDYSELFAGGDSESSAQNTPQNKSNQPVDKSHRPKIGGGKSYQPSRLFDTADPNDKADGFRVATKVNPLKYNHFELSEGGDAPDGSPYKVSPKKYQHFDFADGSDPADAAKPQETPQATRKTKHASQWDFDDFTTPAKPAAQARGQDARHFGWSYSDDENGQVSPVKKEHVPKARRDAETHFDFVDDGSPRPEKQATSKPRGSANNNGLSLYKNNLYDEDESTEADDAPKQRPLSSVTTNISAHRKVFDSQFTMTDDSPVSKGTSKESTQAVPDGRKKVVSMMNANWDMYDQSPGDSRKENAGIKTTGDGMGGRKGATGRAWGIGDENEEESIDDLNGTQARKSNRSRGAQQADTSEHWDF